MAIDTTVTAELAQEGMARDLVRHIQELRRKAGFEISDRIAAYLAGDGDLPGWGRRLPWAW
jgi:isoleucyl-tRNA synthetase